MGKRGGVEGAGHGGWGGGVGGGVHGGVAGGAVPALPPGGGAFGDHVSPGGVGVLEEEFEGDVGAVVVVEDEHEEGRAEEAGGEVVVVDLDVGDEASGHVGAESFGGDAGVEGDDVGRLGVAEDGAVGLDVLLAVGFGDVVVEGLEFFGVFFVAEG